MTVSNFLVPDPAQVTAAPASGVAVLPAGPRFNRARWALADQAVVSAGNFVTVYLLARFIDIAEFGVYMAGLIALLFLVSLQSALVSEPHNVLGARRDPEAYRRLTTVLAATLLPAALAIGICLVLAGALAAALHAAKSASLLIVLGFVVVPCLAQEFVRRVLYTRSETRAACLNDATSHGLQVAGIALLVATVENPTASRALAVLGVASLTATLLGAWQLRRSFTLVALARSSRWAVWLETWAFGKWLLARNLVSWLGQYGHNWLLLVMLGPAALGTYRAADHLLNLVNPLRLAAYSYLPSRASRRCAEGGAGALRPWIGQVYRTVGGAFVGMVLVLILCSGPLLHLAYGEKFKGLPLEWVIVFGGMAAVVNFARIPLEMGILAMQQSRRLFWVHVWSVPLLFVVGTALIGYLGIFGVPISSLVIGSILLALTRRSFLASISGGPVEPPTSVSGESVRPANPDGCSAPLQPRRQRADRRPLSDAARPEPKVVAWMPR